MTAPEESETERPHMAGHIHLKARDVERAIDFYTDILGLDIEERHGRYAFLTFGGRHHDVALQERSIPVSPVDHGISKALYFDDPDGNGLEVYVDTRAENEQDEWDGANRPFDP